MPTKRETFTQTVRARYLGQRMRQLREDRGLTLKYVSEALGVEFSSLARYERAEWPFRKDHVLTLLDVYGVHDEVDRAGLLDLAANAWRSNRWDHAGITTPHDRDAPSTDQGWLQTQAEQVHMYASLLIPDLLHTGDYAHAMISHAHALTGNERTVDSQLHAHQQRQKILTRGGDRPPAGVCAVIEEAALHRPVGRHPVLYDQLVHLVRAGREIPHVDIRVLPTGAGLHPGLHGAFTIYRMAPPYPDVAYVEHLAGQLIIESGGGAELYTAAFDTLREIALDPSESLTLIDKIAAELP